MSKDIYESPLSSRYASPYMLHLFSPDMRFQTWRRLWVELARAEHELGLPITAEQVAELEAHVTDIDYAAAEQREKEVRHDVMAHVYAYGLAAPSAAGIIHLGATSCYVTDNADLILYRDGLRYLRGQILSVLVNLAAFARQYAATQRRSGRFVLGGMTFTVAMAHFSFSLIWQHPSYHNPGEIASSIPEQPIIQVRRVKSFSKLFCLTNLIRRYFDLYRLYL